MQVGLDVLLRVDGSEGKNIGAKALVAFLDVMMSSGLGYIHCSGIRCVFVYGTTSPRPYDNAQDDTAEAPWLSISCSASKSGSTRSVSCLSYYISLFRFSASVMVTLGYQWGVRVPFYFQRTMDKAENKAISRGYG
jgi:hypothetical protein